MPQYDINLREYWRILKKRKFIVILIAIILGLFSSTFAILRAPTSLYTTACIIEFEQTPSVEGIYGSAAPDPDSEIETQITVIKGYPVFQKVAEKLRLIPPGSLKEGRQPEENVIPIIEGLQSKVEVSREKWSFILIIQVTDTNPAFAQKLANTIAYTYRELHAEEQMKRTKETLKYISEQLSEVRERLRESEDEFNRYSQENELISIDLQGENLLARRQQIQDEIRALHEDKRELGEIVQRLNQFIDNPSGSGQDFYSPKANTQYQGTYDSLVALLLKKDTLLKAFTPRHPEVVAISYEIIENARKMLILLQLQISGIEKKVIDLENELQKVDKKTKVLMDKKLEFDRLKRKVDLYTDMAALLEKKNQEALIGRAERPEEVKIVKPALLPTRPINPPKRVATGAAGVLIGLVLGIVIGFVAETFDTSLGAIEDVEETLRTQVLGIVPQADIKDMIGCLIEKHPEGISLPDETRMGYLVSHFVPKSMMAESFRALRTNVQFKEAGKKNKAIVVTSSSPQEGKTLVAVNLAIAMAQARMKVLLVGSDLRKPAVDKVFDVEMTPGLTDILMENYQWRDTVKTVMDMAMGEMTQTQIIRTSGLDNLHIITSGPPPPNPAELIDSTTFTQFIEEVKEKYDVIIFDSPPILSTADAAILGAKVDGVLLVYRLGSVSRGLLKRSTAQLQQVKSNIMGVILNGMRPDVSPEFQDYKYYSYYYSYGEEGKEKRRRDRKKGWAFLTTKKGEEGKGSQEKEAKKPSPGRLLMLLMAAVLLAAGILWQNGVMNSTQTSNAQKAVQKDEMKSVANKGVPSKMVIKKGPKTALMKARPPVSVDEPGGTHETSIPRSRPMRNTLIEPKPLTLKKEISDPSLGREVGVIAKEPQGAAMPKPSPGTEAPVLQSRPFPKVLIAREHPAVEKELSEPLPPIAESKSVPEMPSPVPPNEIPSYPYSLVLYSFRDLKLAKDAVSRYSKRGFSAYWVKVELSNGVWYRVFVGHFQNREEAGRVRREHGLKDAMVKKTRYANLIGIYSASDELEDKIVALKKLDFSPYVIRDENGKSRLFVGAFITKEGVEKGNRDLKSKGIQSEVTEL